MAIKSTVDLEGRRQTLADLLSSSGSLRIEDLAERFKVSTMTVRRDLQALEDEGLARRVRGGAVSGAQLFEAREPRAGLAKAQIARKLSDLVPSGGVGICMDASSTVSMLAASMPDAANLSVVTDGIERSPARPPVHPRGRIRRCHPPPLPRSEIRAAACASVPR